MVSISSIINRFRESSITFNGPKNGPMHSPSTRSDKEKSHNPRMKTLEQQKNRQRQQLEQTQKKIDQEKQRTKLSQDVTDADLAREMEEKEQVARDLGLRDVEEIESLVGRRGRYGVVLSDKGDLGPGIEHQMARAGLRSMKSGYTLYFDDWSLTKSDTPIRTAFDPGPRSEKFTQPEQYKTLNAAKQIVKSKSPSEALIGFNNAWNAWGPVFYTIALNASHPKAPRIWDTAIVSYEKRKNDEKAAQSVVQTLKSHGFDTDRLDKALDELHQPDIWTRTPTKELNIRPKEKDDIFTAPKKPEQKKEEETMFVRSSDEWVERLSSISDRIARVNQELASRLNRVIASVMVEGVKLQTLPGPIETGTGSRIPYRVVKKPRVEDPDESFGDPNEDVTVLFPTGMEMKVKVKDLKNLMTKK